MNGWLVMGQIRTILVVVSLAINVIGFVVVKHHQTKAESFVLSLQTSIDSLQVANESIKRRVNDDSLLIADLLTSKTEAQNRISEWLQAPVHTDSLKGEVWEFLSKRQNNENK